MKKILFFLLFLLIIGGIAAGGAYLWYKKQINIPASDSSKLATVEIEKNEGVKAIAVKLQSAGIIKSSDIFFLYIKLNNIAEKIQAGKFEIPQNLTVIEVAEIIQKAAGNDIWITIPEGLRLDEIANILDKYFLKEDNTKFNKKEFLEIVQNPDKYTFSSTTISYKPSGKSLEGFLLPDTYSVKKDISSKEIVDLFLTELEKKLADNNIDMTSHKDLSAYEVLTLASIIEREARTSEERFMIADILLKRLRGEMEGVKLLQTDAALLYELKDWKAVVTKELKDKDSPYNTYKYTGLPPTPICNPGIDSIKAVMNPTENDYFFYLHDDEGKIHYAKTNKEHVNNERCYINKNKDYCL
jgi:UPF0755 protein